MTTQKFDLSQLISATSKDSTIPTKRVRKESKRLRARLLAQEYVRNGMNLGAAYRTVTKMEPRNLSLDQMVRGNVDDFVEELRMLVDAAQIDQSAVLNNLWTLIQSSIFDFFDENGNTLTIKQIKQLPRVYQQLVEQVKVKRVQLPVNDKDGKPLLDDKGSPYLRVMEEVEIKLPPKLVAIELLAKIMKWIGPNVVINNNNTNIAVVMTEKAQARRRLEDHYARVIDGEAVPAKSGATEPSHS